MSRDFVGLFYGDQLADSFNAGERSPLCCFMLQAEKTMKPRISVLTLGVADLERSLAFYRDGLGLPTKGIIGREFEHGAVAFFDLSGGLKLAIWGQDDVAHDTGLKKTPMSPTSFTIGHNVTRREQVDEVMEQARQAGAKIVKPAQNTFWGGYAGYFSDPDGHVWEAVWNPDSIPTDE
jgi:catechol 2,3-dioxygenase-like lactoylglutathione lyase family enzyme